MRLPNRSRARLLLAAGLVLLAAQAGSVRAQEDQGRFGFGALPALNYSADQGFGYGVVGSLYRYDGERRPYAWSLDLQIFVTTRWVRDHRLRLDLVDAFGLPLRLTIQARYKSTLSEAFCGFGNAAQCDPDEAQRAAEVLGIPDAESETFLARFHRTRYVQPHGTVTGRWRLGALGQADLEAVGAWYLAYHLPGKLGERGPYPGSLYARLFPNGEEGLLSRVQAGLSLDSRDHEPSPTKGYWHEVGVGLALPQLGSAWTHLQLSAALRFYRQLVAGLVLAHQTTYAQLFGDAPAAELPSIGGAAQGRGITAYRYRGKLKFLTASELRFTFATLQVGEVPLDLSALGFVDAGWLVYALDDVREHSLGRLVATGAGLRVVWDRTFVIRADLGFSPVERWSPRLYIELGHVF